MDQVCLLKNPAVFRKVAEGMNLVYYVLSQLVCYFILSYLSAYTFNQNTIQVKEAIFPTVLQLQLILWKSLG